MSKLDDAVRELMDVFADSGLPLLHGICWRHSTSLKPADSAGRPVAPDRNHLLALSQALQPVRDHLRPDLLDARPLVVELRNDGGRPRFRYTFDLSSISPAQIVLDQEYRHPHRPRPGMPMPAGIAVTHRHTDPAVVAEVGDLVTEWVGLYRAIKGRDPQLGPPLAEESILAAERAMGVRLPEDVRALYRAVSDAPGWGLLGPVTLYPLDGVVEMYLEGGPGSWCPDDVPFTDSPVVFEPYPNGMVRRISRSDWWVTIGADLSGDWCAVDLDPAPRGRSGQLIGLGTSSGEPYVSYVEESVTARIRRVLTGLRSGAYTSDPDSPDLVYDEFTDDTLFDPQHRSEQLGNRSVAQVVGGLRAPDEVQQLVLHDGDAVDLAELWPLRNLRDVRVQNVTGAGLAVPHEVPVESLTVDGAAVDLAPLAGHPTLWRVALTNIAAPVRIEPLAALPALVHLDISGVEVADLDRIETLHRLRVLALGRHQWRWLRERGAVPTGLAAAAVTDHIPLDEAIDWAAWLHAR